ncbi:hypothetical protein Rt10032_c05g2396 [Rhodotorula toruloides]|uniref:Uncharacterized protein n=1 Tax=Rhodotorula toruloides TaxID=5286 RepID=A0A511KDA8_RHOTO|nr:hypothetical protein Rt10032_c05g2396 [Rhodotorula toruloides]
MTPKDVRKRFNTHKIACVQTLNVELIKFANELVKEKPLKQVEYMPLMQRLQSNLAYLTAMSQINQKQDGTRSSPPPPILEAPSTPILGPRLAASYATLKGYFIAAEKYEIQYKRGLTIVPTAASDNTGIHSIASVGERSPMSSRVGITSTSTLASSEVNGAGGKRTREEEVTGGREGATAGPGDWMDGPDAKKGKLDLPTVPEEEVVPANPPPSNALAPPANLVVNQPPAAIGFPGTPSDNAARFNAPPPDTAYAASPAHNQVFPPPSGPLATASIPQARRSATPSQSFATPQQPPSRPTSAQPGQMYGSAIPPHLQQQQAQQVQQSPRQNQYGAPPQQEQQQLHHLMRSQQAQAPDRPPCGCESRSTCFCIAEPAPQQVPPSAPSAVTGTSGVGGDDRPIAEQYSSVQAIISAPTFRQLPPALQQQMQTQAQNLLYQMQAQAVAAARGGGVDQGQQQQCMMTPAPPGPAAVASSPRNRVPSYSQSPHVAHAQVRQASVGVAEPQYAGSYAGSLAGSPPVMQQIPQQQQVRPTSATSTGDNSSAAFFREQLAAQQQALRSSTPAQYASSPQQQHMSVAPSPHLQPNRPPSTPANHAAFGAHQRVASGPYQQQANPYTQQVASPVQYVAASPAQQHAPSPAGYPVPQPQQPYQQAGTPASRLFSTGSVAAAPSPRAPSRGPGTPGPGPQQRVPQQYQYVPKPSQQQYLQQSFAHPPQQQQQFPSQQAPAGSFASSAVPSAALSMPPPPAPTAAAQRPQLPLQPLTSASTATSSIPVSAVSGSSPFLTGTSPSATLAGNVASTNAFATGSASWNSVNLGTPSVGVGLPGSDPWGNPLDSLASSSTANAGNPSTDISMAADDDWESFLNL